ncbi:choice-of-anchor L domain-containing protein [Flavobacterium oreochromis]|uniref:T9SS type B sorting domain-containing protein n=1 Tax=Flavobacterium oreochromis TaxID=2906078 RepID=UPI00385978A3
MLKRYPLLLVFFIGFYSNAQFISVETNRTSDDLVRNILTQSVCINVSNVKSSTGTNFGSTNGIGYFKNTNPSFPLSEGVILSTGDAIKSIGPNTSRLQDGSDTWPGDNDLRTIFTTDPAFPPNFVNATKLEFDFSTLSSYVEFPFVFTSEEYGTYQCNTYDGVAILLTHPDGRVENLAVVPNTNTPISVESIRNNLYNSSCNSANSTFFGSFNGGINSTTSAINYNGQTTLLKVSKNDLIPGATYHLKVVIGDRNVTSDDSAIFLGKANFTLNTSLLGPDLTLCTNEGANESYTLQTGLNPSAYDFEWKDQNNNSIGSNSPDLTVNQAGTYRLTYYIKSTPCIAGQDDIKISYQSSFSSITPKNLYKCDTNSSNYDFDLSFNQSLLNPTGNLKISFYESQSDAQQNINPIHNNYNVPTNMLPKSIWVRIENQNGCYNTKSFDLLLTASPSLIQPADITKCENIMGTGETSISKQEFLILTNNLLNGLSNSIYQINYHLKADFSDAPIDTSTSFFTKSTTIYIKLFVKTETNCFVSQSFKITTIPRPTLKIIKDQYVCSLYTLPIESNGTQYWSGPNQTGTNWPAGTDITVDGTVVYQYLNNSTLSDCYSENSFIVHIVKPNQLTPLVLTNCDSYVVPAPRVPGSKYYLDSALTQEISPGTNITTIGETTLYVSFAFSDPSCPPIITNFKINISKSPTMSNSFTNLFSCTPMDNLPVLTTDIGTANYYTYDNQTATYTLLHFPITQTTHVYAYASNNNCKSNISDFWVYIGDIGLKNIDSCSKSYILDKPILGEFRDAPNGGGNLISTPKTITQNTTIYHYIAGANCTYNTSFNINFHQPFLTSPPEVNACINYILPTENQGGRYFTLQGGPNTPGNIELFPNNEIKTSTTLWIYKESNTAPSTLTTKCYNEVPWKITIFSKPAIDVRGDQITCFKYELTPLKNGKYYQDPNGQNLITNLTIDSSDLRPGIEQTTRIKTIYIYSVNPVVSNCFSESSFTITFDSLEVPVQTDKLVCNSYTLPNLPTNMLYYDSPMDPAHPELPHPGKMIPPGTTYNALNVISPIYVYTSTNNKLKCIDEKSFKLTIIPQPIASKNVKMIPACDEFQDPYDGIYEFDLSKLNSQVLGNSTSPNDLKVEYFKSFNEANDINAIALNTTYKNEIPFTQSIWARLSSTKIKSCFDVSNEIKLIVNPLPKSDLQPEYIICEDHETGTLYNQAVLETGLSSNDYKFQWSYNGTPLSSKTSSITTSQDGNYSVTITNNNTNCTKNYTTKVTKYTPYLILEYSNAFETPSYISVTVLGNGSGNYSYQLDNGNYQDSNLFYNVSSGEHSISSKDNLGHCSPAPITISIINHPKYFTPNGDGYNDYWNITDLRITNPTASIQVFDRYEKLIQRFTPNSKGWDGTYEGIPLPADDYWFTVEYDEKNYRKIFKSHFTLKR